jgi:hypothetical protein
MSIPDAPWVGKCAEDYYGYEEEAETACCDHCCLDFDRDEMIYENGELLCEECYKAYYGDEEVEA